MIAKAITSSLLTKQVAFSIYLHSTPVRKHYDNNFKIARQSVATLIKRVPVQPKYARQQFAFHPLAFKEGTVENKNIVEQIEHLQSYAKQGGNRQMIGKNLLALLFKSRNLVLKTTLASLKDMLAALEQHNFTQAQIQSLINGCPHVFNAKFRIILDQKFDLFREYLDLDISQTLSLFECSPFLLTSSTYQIQQSIVVLLKKYGYTKPEIVQFARTFAQIFILGGKNLEDIRSTPKKWGLNDEETRNLFQKHPLLFLNYPYDVMPLKRKILKYLNFTAKMGKKLIEQYPQVLIWSVRSLQAKAIFIKNRLGMQMDEQTIELLGFNYNKTLRPRGQMLIRSKHIYTNENIVELMKLSETEFVNRLDIDFKKLEEERNKYPISEQLDFRRSKKLQNCATNDKIKKMAEKYRKH